MRSRSCSRGRPAPATRPRRGRSTTPRRGRPRPSSTSTAGFSPAAATRAFSPAPGREAAAPRLSLLEVAERGTLFLEEVQRLPAEQQERLAAVIESAEAAREEGAVPAPDVRVVASSSEPWRRRADSTRACSRRLEARQLRVPALAERAEDVPELAQFFVRQHARRVGSVAERVSEASREEAAALPLARRGAGAVRASSSGRSRRRAARSSRSTPASSTRGCPSGRIASSRSSARAGWGRSGGRGTSCSPGRAP